MFSRVLANGYHSAASMLSLKILRPRKSKFKSVPSVQILQVLFFFISDRVPFIISFKSKGRHILHIPLHLSKHAVIAGGTCSHIRSRNKTWKSLLWCVASSKGTEHHLEFICSCQIIQLKGKKPERASPNLLHKRLQTSQSLSYKPGTTLIFTLAVQNLYFSVLYLGEFSQQVPSTWLVAGLQTKPCLQLPNHCTAH